LLELWGWFYLVSPGKFVRKKAISLGVTGAVIVGVILLAQRFGIGGRLVEGFGGLGKLVTEGPLKFIEEFAKGAGQIGTESVKISENFQRALGGGLLASEQELFGGGGFVGGTITEQAVSTQAGEKFPTFLKNAFAAFDPGLSTKNKRSTTKKPDPENVFNVAKAFAPAVQAKRISLQITANPKTTAFGGFAGVVEQESALQKAIAKSRQLNPQFFNI